MGVPSRPDYWARATITHTMADSRRVGWELALGQFKAEIKCVLEIGSYEGQSALFWHHYFGAHVTCIDSWQDKDAAKGCTSGQEVEAHFDKNVHDLPVKKIKSESTPALMKLSGEFDLVYIDGDHTRLQVMIDSCLAWRLLRKRGFMVWDDYRYYRPDLIDRPTPAIDAFCKAMNSEIIVVKDTGQQLMVRKWA
jgi:predicted O-methyltransferase YrrM